MTGYGTKKKRQNKKIERDYNQPSAVITPHLDRYVIKMKIIKLQAKDLTTWQAFHNTFKQELKFPNYYGNNMNAWIDCMSDICLEDNIKIVIENIDELIRTNNDIYEALVECSAFVNYRQIETNTSLSLAYFKQEKEST